jgi:hypothetical protein
MIKEYHLQTVFLKIFKGREEFIMKSAEGIRNIKGIFPNNQF